MENLSGKVIKGYELRERIGAGGFGAVYRAAQSTIGREVAIKFILPHFANHPDFIRRFETEAQLVARLEHPYIIPLYDYWRDPDGAYLVMRYLRGGSLREALQNGAFGLGAAATLIEQISGALTSAHRGGVIHRDLKPGNILLDEDGNAYLADFGIAKDLLNNQPATTEIDAIVGSPDYLAPEQARSEQVTPRTDIYSLGVVLYEMLAGEHPFPNMNAVERLYKHLSEPLPELMSLPDDVIDSINHVIQKATAKDPAQRYGDVLEFAAAFRDAVRQNGASASQNIVEVLTQREQEILQLIIDGSANKEIAQKLFLSPATVKWYIKQIYAKLGVRSRVQAIVRARELHLITGGASILPDSMTLMPTDQFQPENPYKGLRAFQSADYQDFYGREKLVEKLIKRMAFLPTPNPSPSQWGGEKGEGMSRFLAVVGPSGSGKSSLVKAGLIPALWRGDLPGSEKWFVVEMLPGSHPLDELEVALSRIAANQVGSLNEQLRRDERGLLRIANLILPNDGSELVLVIDQFEEVFTLLEDENARIHFLKLLHAAVTEPRSRVRVVVTLRADYYDRPLHYAEFGELLRNHMETVLPLSADGLERAIARPAERVGVTFEAGLVASIIEEINYQSGALPLLQYALTELFEQRKGRLLTREAYEAIGRTTGALAKRAEEIYQSLDDTAKEAARQMFLRLVTLGEGAEDTRRRATRSELLAVSGEWDTMEEIIDTYAEYRLLSLDNDPGTRAPTVEVAHEAILREWERLRGWLNDSRDEIRLQRQLANAAQEWRDSKQEASFLLRGSRLETFETWTKDTQLALTPKERDFVAASLTQREQEQVAEQERQLREKALERRSQNFLRGLVAVLLVAVVGAFGLTAVAINQSNIAQRERDLSQQAQATLSANFQHVDSLRLAAVADNVLSDTYANRNTGALLALRSLRYGYLSEGDEVLQRMMENGFAKLTFQHPSATEAVDFSPDGRLAATSDENGLIFLWDTSSGEQVRPLVGHNDAVITVDFSPDGRTLLSASVDGTARLWEVASGSQIRQWDHQGVVTQASFSHDGIRIVTGGEDDTIHIWDADSGDLLLEFPANQLFVDAVIFSPDGQFVLSGGDDGSVRLWDAATGELRREFLGHTYWVETLDFSSDGSKILTGSDDGTARLWDAVTGEVLQEFTCSRGVLGVDISADDQFALIGCGTGPQIWDLVTGQLNREYLVTINARRVRFSPDGQYFLVSSDISHAYLWEIHPLEYPRAFASGSVTQDVAFSPDGRLLATGSGDLAPELILWDFATGEVRWRYTDFDSQVTNVDFSPDGRTLAANSRNIAVLFDTETGVEIGRFITEQGGELWGLDFSPDGRTLVTASFREGNSNSSGVVSLWDLASKVLIWQTVGSDTDAIGAAFSPDGRSIITGSHDGFARLWDSATGEEIRRFRHPSSAYHVAFSHDGRYVATAGWDYIARLWDVNTGEEVRQFIGHSNVLTGIAFSSDDRYLLTGSSDGTARLWDTASGELLRTYFGDNNVIEGVEFSRDDEFVVGSSWGGFAYAWERDSAPMVEFICSRLVDDFTVLNRQRYAIPDLEPTCPSNPNIIASETTLESVYAVGDFQRPVGCIGVFIWNCEITRMADNDGDGRYELTLTNIPVGRWFFGVGLNGRGVAYYGSNGPNTDTMPFDVPAENLPVTFAYDSETHVITVDVPEQSEATEAAP